MTTAPAPGNEPHRPDGATIAPTAPGTTLQPPTRAQKILTAIVVGAVLIIATLGFIGSYSAVTRLAQAKGFGEFAHAFPIAVDAGIIAFLALDLLLTWRRIAFPLLRYTAWTLTAATIAFNAATAWPDKLGTAMHGVIPILFVIAVEAARHAIGRIADITADKHLEGPNFARWLLNPAGTFILWRRQRLWGIRTWHRVLELERERRIYIGQLRKDYGRWTWRRNATAEKLLVLHLATKNAMSVTEAMALPALEEKKRRDEEARIAREQQQAEDERARQAEADRLEQERQALELEKQRAQAEREQQIAEAETRARLAEIARREQEAAADTERRRQQEQLEHARRVAAEQERAAQAARQRRENEEAAARAAAEKEAARRRAAEIVQRTASASQAAASTAATSASASRSTATQVASASRPAASQPANAASTPAANETAEPASTASASTASTPDASRQAANATASHTAATAANDDAITEVVGVYTLLKEKNGKAPSDRELGDALGVSRSRAQQLRTAAIDAGHTELAKPLRIAS